jgi:hypothetical protein
MYKTLRKDQKKFKYNETIEDKVTGCFFAQKKSASIKISKTESATRTCSQMFFFKFANRKSVSSLAHSAITNPQIS